MPATGRGAPAPARVGTLLAAGTAGWEPAALEAFAGQRQVTLVKRCLDLADLLATASTGTAQVAVVSDQLPGLDADSVDRLRRDGVRTVVITGSTAGRRGREDPLDVRTRLLRMGVARVVDEDAIPMLAQHVLDAAVQEVGRSAGPAGTAVDGVPDASSDPGPGSAATSLAEGGSPPGARDSSSAGMSSDAGVPSDGAEPWDAGVLSDAQVPRASPGRIVAVWGPTGAPGRTTVTIGLAAELARRDCTVTMVDADPYGGAVGQHLAVLDEVSGLLAAARLANAGELDVVRLAGLAREIVPGLRLLTGLPRPDRWTDVRPQALSEVLLTARQLDEYVVVDAGFGLPSTPLDPFAAAPGRDDITLTVLEEADHLLVVGAADPVGLTRLVRSLRDVTEVRPSGPDVVVVNRMRSSLGWSTREIGDLVAQVVPQAELLFLPDDQLAADRALVSGRTLIESGDSPLRRAVAHVAEALLPEPARRAPAR